MDRLAPTIAHAIAAVDHGVMRDRLLKLVAAEHMIAAARDLHRLQQRDHLPRQRHDMLPLHRHAAGGHPPDGLGRAQPFKLTPCGEPGLIRPRLGQRHKNSAAGHPEALWLSVGLWLVVAGPA